MSRGMRSGLQAESLLLAKAAAHDPFYRNIYSQKVDCQLKLFNKFTVVKMTVKVQSTCTAMIGPPLAYKRGFSFGRSIPIHLSTVAI